MTLGAVWLWIGVALSPAAGAASSQFVVSQLAGLPATPVAGHSAGTLERVREAGAVRCGITPSGAGLAAMDEAGHWRGFFADMCRALAAAVVGSTEGAVIVETGTENRFSVLREGNVDVVMEGSTWTLQREASLAVAFPIVYMFDAQGFMAHRSIEQPTLAAIARSPQPASVCVVEGTTTVRNLEDWIARTGARLTLKRARSTEGALGAFFNHHCDLYTGDRVGLYAQRAQAAPNGDDYRILPDVISREPLAPMVRNDDHVWFNIVRWVVLSTILAEEKGVTAATAAQRRLDGDIETQRLLGGVPGLGQGLGLDDEWGWRVVTQVGSYAEIYDRNLGQASPLKIDRGINSLWSAGGLLYAPPLGW